MRSDRIRRLAPQKLTNRSAIALMHFNWYYENRMTCVPKCLFCSFREWHWSAKQPKSSKIGSINKPFFSASFRSGEGFESIYVMLIRGRMHCTVRFCWLVAFKRCIGSDVCCLYSSLCVKTPMWKCYLSTLVSDLVLYWGLLYYRISQTSVRNSCLLFFPQTILSFIFRV